MQGQHQLPQRIKQLLYEVWGGKQQNLFPDKELHCPVPADVQRTLRKVNIWKAAGPDHIPGKVHKKLLNNLLGCSQTSSTAHCGSPWYRPVLRLPQSYWYRKITQPPPHHDERLWEAGKGPNHYQTPPNIQPITVCLSPQPLHRERHLLCTPLESRASGGKNAHVQMLFLDFSSTFNTIIPQH